MLVAQGLVSQVLVFVAIMAIVTDTGMETMNTTTSTIKEFIMKY